MNRSIARAASFATFSAGLPRRPIDEKHASVAPRHEAVTEKATPAAGPSSTRGFVGQWKPARSNSCSAVRAIRRAIESSSFVIAPSPAKSKSRRAPGGKGTSTSGFGFPPPGTRTRTRPPPFG